MRTRPTGGARRPAVALKEKIGVNRTGVQRCLAAAVLCVACAVQGAWAQGVGGGARGPATSVDGAYWLEAIEVYTLPWDPQWEEAARNGNMGSFRQSADEIAEARSRTPAKTPEGKPSRARAAIEARAQKLVENLHAASGKAMPLTVVRAWNGISRNEWILTFGKGQRASADRLAQGKPLLGVVDLSRPGDDFQAVRPTVVELRPSSKIPSDFVRVSDAPSALQDIAFGEVNASTLSGTFVILAVKDSTPASGVLRLEIPHVPDALGIDARYPWYAKFRLFELTKDGSRGREVPFDGVDAIVSTKTPRSFSRSEPEFACRLSREVQPGLGRIEVKSPQPWGYEAEIVKWYGVAPKDRLVPDAKGAKAKSAGGGGRTAPTTPADTPVEETDPPELPDEPTTPSVPESSS